MGPRALCLLLLAAGCGQSLFDAHGRRDGGGRDDAGDDGGGDAMVPETCPPGSCIADAAADFKNAQGGANGHWFYFEDKRNRTWVMMTPNMGGMVGAEQTNRIDPCAGSSEAGCQALTSALLVSSSAAAADPAIEFLSFEPKVVQLALRVRIDRAMQRVRLYRNSREDVLFTATGSPGETVMTTITLDALALDRFLVALEPTDGSAGLAAVQFFVIDAGKSFPQTCQLAIPFTSNGLAMNSVRDLCGSTDVLSRSDNASTPPGTRYDAFNKPSGAAYFEPALNYLGAKQLDHSGPLTVQFWAIQDTPLPSLPTAWLFSDIDEVGGGGLGIQLRLPTMTGAPIRIEASVLTTVGPASYAYQGVDFGIPDTWYFVRVIHAAGKVTICLDGKQVLNAALAGPAASGQPPSLARNAPWEPTSNLLGGLDEVRVFSGALPCD